jgi:hypothetical protein
MLGCARRLLGGSQFFGEPLNGGQGPRPLFRVAGLGGNVLLPEN